MDQKHVDLGFSGEFLVVCLLPQFAMFGLYLSNRSLAIRSSGMCGIED
jgi:hypothetical protein